MGFLSTLRSKRIKAASGLLSLFLILWIVQGRVESTELRGRNNQERLLFWSLFDFNIDAATQQLGPLDFFVRGEDELDDVLLEEVEGEALIETSWFDRPKTTVRLLPNITEQKQQAQQQQQQAQQQQQQQQAVAETEDAEAAIPTNNNNYNNNNNNSLLTMRGGARRKPPKLIYTLFQRGDGSETDADGIPTRFLNMHSQDRTLAAESLRATLEWRKKHKIDNLLNTPQHKFDLCKKVFPHYFLNTRDAGGHIVFVQHPPKLDLELARRNQLHEEELLMHYVYVNEYLWQVLEKDAPLATMTSIIDLQGLQLWVLRKGDIISFVKKFVSTMDSYYPQRAHKTLVLNCPKWFNAIYKLVSPLMRETTKSKIEIHVRGKAQDEALKRHLGKDAVKMLPESFWSSWKVPKKDKKKKKRKGRWGKRKQQQEEEEEEEQEEEETEEHVVFVPPESKLERDLRDFALARTRAAGKEMQAVV